MGKNRNTTVKNITIYPTLDVVFYVYDGFIDEAGLYHLADLTNKQLLFANWTEPEDIGVEYYQYAVGQADYGHLPRRGGHTVCEHNNAFRPFQGGEVLYGHAHPLVHGG